MGNVIKYMRYDDPILAKDIFGNESKVSGVYACSDERVKMVWINGFLTQSGVMGIRLGILLHNGQRKDITSVNPDDPDSIDILLERGEKWLDELDNTKPTD